MNKDLKLENCLLQLNLEDHLFHKVQYKVEWKVEGSSAEVDEESTRKR